MKKIIGIILAVMIVGTLSAQIPNTFHYVINADGGLKAALGATSNVVSTAEYVIDKVGSTYYARPGIGTGLTAYSNANATIVIRGALSQLPSGGTVFIKAGLYDNLDTITIPYNYIKIIGAGKYLTKLKAKANFDVGKHMWTGLIRSGTSSYWSVEHLELDGNGANQSGIDNGASLTARVCGILACDRDTWSIISHITINDCYIHDFTVNGIVVRSANDCVVSNNILINNYYNHITIDLLTNRCEVFNNYCKTAGDVGITMMGRDINCYNNVIDGMSGTHGSLNSGWGIGIEGQWSTGYARRISIKDNTVTGAGIIYGIRSEDCTNGVISGNRIHDIAGLNCVGFRSSDDSLSLISNNKIWGIASTSPAMQLHQLELSSVLNNDINSTTGYGLDLVQLSKHNKVIGNTSIGTRGIILESGCDANYVFSNTGTGIGAVNRDLVDLGAGNILKLNYGILDAKWIQETGLQGNTNTATSDGLTTGIIAQGSQNLTVTSANAAYIICLPAASATTIGTKITGIVTANGCDLRVQAAQATTVYLNGLTTNVEADIPASSSFEVTCIDATHWILKAWTNLGAPITTIVPHAN